MAAACCSSLSDPVRLTVIGFGRRGFTTNERSYIFLGRQSSDPSRRLLFSSLPGQAVTWSDRHLKPSAAVINAAEHAQTFPDDLQLGTWMVAADIDPATAKLAIGVLGPFLSALAFLFIIRIVMSWYPKLPVGKFPYVVAYAPTEPILAVTRKVIPPLAGVDVTPVVWFGLVSFLNEILVGPQGLLVLISQQVN